MNNQPIGNTAMPSTQAPSKLFDEIATLFASDPRPQRILDFRPSDETVKRASELLELNRQGRLSDELCQELDQFEQADLLMRLVKARIRSGQDHDARSA
jgi:hypothetical protein